MRTANPCSERAWLPPPTPARNVALVLLILAMLLLSSPACRRSSTGAGDGSQPRHIRLGYQPINVYLPLFVALEKGYLKKRGLEVEAVRFESSPLLGTALMNNDVDACSMAYSVALSIESRDPGRYKIFMVDAENARNYLSAMVTMPNSGISRVEDLRGKRVGSYPGPTALTFFGLILKKHGLDPNRDVNIIELAPGLHVQALVSGQVDALNTFEPMATEAVVNHHAVKFLPGAIESEIIEPWQAGTWLLSRRFMEEQPQAARDVVAALYEAVDEIRAHPQDAKRALGNYTGINPLVADNTPDIPFTKIGEVDLEAFQKHADILQQAGVISRRVEARALLLDPGFIAGAGPH
jgi:NitT/TauT family transport system substrate-binding protein